LAVPNNALFDGSVDRIAYATEYREEDKSTLKVAAKFAGWFDAELHVVHIDVSHTENYTAGIYKFLNEIDDLPKVKPHVIDDTNIEHGLTEFLHEFEIDILAMRIKKRSFMQELFTYSMTKKMANHLHVPILGLHA
jgi:K+-sensing histidine kinase KdpD